MDESSASAADLPASGADAAGSTSDELTLCDAAAQGLIEVAKQCLAANVDVNARVSCTFLLASPALLTACSILYSMWNRWPAVRVLTELGAGWQTRV